ncbi:unnamed protein product [Rotaria sordida]|uniref:HAT C-terminal dimerisation domain-containing protein n=1 Tax=Rotaria sordida TaxID=392033 RepID=A0A814LUR9_9BILA|nr:unnamed protein product [Rotaria sordida]
MIFLASVLRQKFSRDRQVYRYSSETFINTQQSYNHQMSEQKLKYEKINQVFHREYLVLEKEQSKESLTQLCQQIESIYILINTTNNNDSPVKIEMDITSLNPLLEIFNENSLNEERINIIISSILDKIIDFLKPWTHIMKRIQSLQVPSIHTVTPTTVRVLAVPATSAAVEREFSFTDNTITQKRSKLPSDTGNDIVFNH